LKKIKSYIEKNKKYDTYHSSIIEGYRVTTEEIQLLIEGREIISTGKTREEIERKMALKGYLEAHKFVLQTIEEHFIKNIPLTELMIRDIYAHLFSPSVEAGILKKEQLIQYRNDAVFIRNSRYVPPNYLKINELMRCLVEEINEIESNVTQAIIAHYGFVTAHPYFDGNGRVARLLMNYLLCRGGIPWITVRVEDRDQYFSALETAQCDENFEPFIKFLKKYLKENGSPENQK
jgi:Fic family protein